jgi:hypothetical protein
MRCVDKRPRSTSAHSLLEVWFRGKGSVSFPTSMSQILILSSLQLLTPLPPGSSDRCAWPRFPCLQVHLGRQAFSGLLASTVI